MEKLRKDKHGSDSEEVPENFEIDSEDSEDEKKPKKKDVLKEEPKKVGAPKPIFTVHIPTMMCTMHTTSEDEDLGHGLDIASEAEAPAALPKDDYAAF